ncbi:unnamed protein product [Menidia menidia]|uniref:(Atlantic silverside) hypothetical protein n=1 Tax=Menidia menidia TaxID=238744 RepID=A0A8S4BT77_9TELE|nr:unnamed protein product [Menidia menidia]
MDDLSRLKADFSYSWAWFGLWDDPENWKTSMGNDTNSWRWSATGETSRTGYQTTWFSGQPNYAYQNKACVEMSYTGRWDDVSCEGTKGFVCYNVSENNKKNYFHIPTSKTWQSAQQHCREHFTDLAMIENEAENTEAFTATLGTGWYWIGLYRNPWTWSDRSQSSFRNRHPSFKLSNGQHCFAENTDHEWVPNSCGAKLPFICHQGLPLSYCSQPPPRQYHYVPTEMNWTEARQFCREKYTDLATFDSMEDLSRLKADFSYSRAWIGLWDDPENWKTSMGNDTNSWRWSATGETSRTGYQNWHPGEPNDGNSKETCVIMLNDGLWANLLCVWTRGFICYNENNKKNYFHIPTKKKWQSAQQHCRENFTDLAMIENEAENTEAINATPGTGWYWIGLYRNPWHWSDRSQSSFRNWHPTYKDHYYYGQRHCVIESTDHEWIPHDCGNKLPFICHQGDY